MERADWSVSAYEHRSYAVAVSFSDRAVRAAPAAELRKIMRGMVAHAIARQTGLGLDEALRLVREGVVRVSFEEGAYRCAGTVAVRLDG